MDSATKDTLSGRLILIINRLFNGNVYNFSVTVGIKDSTMRSILGGTDARVSNIQKVLECLPRVSAEWLIKGEGEMFKDELPLSTIGMDNVKQVYEEKERLEHVLSAVKADYETLKVKYDALQEANLQLQALVIKLAK